MKLKFIHFLTFIVLAAAFGIGQFIFLISRF